MNKILFYFLKLFEFCVLIASETGLLLVVKLRRNVMLMYSGVKIIHQVMRDAVKSPNKKIDYSTLFFSTYKFNNFFDNFLFFSISCAQ